MRAKLIGKCIYCLSLDSPIDEHIIPKSLGGLSTLQKASCKKCANITSLIIQKTTRGVNSFFGKSRIILGMPSRRKSDRPKIFVQKIVDENTKKVFNLEVPTIDFIDNVYLPIYALPSIFIGETITHGIITNGVQLVNANIDKIKKGKKYINEFRLDSSDFPKLLALIAYCTSVDEFGLEEVKNSPLIPIILGQTDDFGTWIGMADDVVMKKQNKLVDVAYSRSNNHIKMRIKFFNWITDLPEYLVCVK